MPITNIWVQHPLKAPKTGFSPWMSCAINLNETGLVESIQFIDTVALENIIEFPVRLRVVDTNKEPASCYWLYVNGNKELYKIELPERTDKAEFARPFLNASPDNPWGPDTNRKKIDGIDSAPGYDRENYNQIKSGVGEVAEIKELKKQKALKELEALKKLEAIQAIRPLTADMLDTITVRPLDPVVLGRLVGHDIQEERIAFTKHLADKFREKVYGELSIIYEKYRDKPTSLEYTH